MIRIGLLILTLPLLYILGGYFSELSEVNECLAQKGSFDYLRLVCDSERKHPFIPYFARHQSEVNGAMLVALAGLLICIAGLYRGRR